MPTIAGTEPLLDGARVVHIVDMADDRHPLTRAAAGGHWVRTTLVRAAAQGR